MQDYAIAHSLRSSAWMKRGDTRFIVEPDGSMMDPRETGVFGENFLTAFDLELDLAGHKAILACRIIAAATSSTGSKDYARVPITIGHFGHIFLWVKLDGRTMRAVLDTGADESILPLAVAARFRG